MPTCDVDTRTFLGLEATHNRFRWKLPVTPGLVTPMGFLYGGVGLAAAIEAMEATSGRRCVWATAQYLTYALTGRIVDIDVRLAVEGHHITQARAVCHVEDTEVLTVNAALGEHPFDREGQFEPMPDDVPPPEACATRIGGADLSGSVFGRMEQRIARGRNLDELDGTPGDGRSQMWARIPEVTAGIDAAALAVLGDYVPVGVSQALGIRGGGNSLDNTLAHRAHDGHPVGAPRHPPAGRRARLRPRRDPHVRHRRHAARDRQPELHRPLLARRRARPL